MNAACCVPRITTAGEEIMAHVISKECVACGTCESECPVSAIVAGDPIYVIDEEKCVDCGKCVDLCPVSAIAPKQ